MSTGADELHFCWDDSTGSELELRWSPLQGLEARAGLSYLDTEVDRTPTSIRGAPFVSPLAHGDPLSYAPEVSYFAVGRYSRGLSSRLLGSVQISFSHRDEMVTLLGDRWAQSAKAICSASVSPCRMPTTSGLWPFSARTSATGRSEPTPIPICWAISRTRWRSRASSA